MNDALPNYANLTVVYFLVVANSNSVATTPIRGFKEKELNGPQPILEQTLNKTVLKENRTM